MTFKNDLDNEILRMQICDQREMMYERTKAMTIRTYAALIPFAIGLSTCVIFDNPYFALLGLTGVGINAFANTKPSLFPRSYKTLLKEQMELEAGNWKALRRMQRKRDFQTGRLKINHADAYYNECKEEVEEKLEFPILEGPIPMAILNEEETTQRLLHEYDLYNKKYDLPERTIKEQELEVFVNSIYQALKKKGLPHRLYTYLTEYFKQVLTRRLVDFEEDFRIEDLLRYLYLWEQVDFTKEEIEQIEAQIREKLGNTKENTKKMNKLHK